MKYWSIVCFNKSVQWCSLLTLRGEQTHALVNYSNYLVINPHEAFAYSALQVQVIIAGEYMFYSYYLQRNSSNLWEQCSILDCVVLGVTMVLWLCSTSHQLFKHSSRQDNPSKCLDWRCGLIEDSMWSITWTRMNDINSKWIFFLPLFILTVLCASFPPVFQTSSAKLIHKEWETWNRWEYMCN